MVIFIPVAQGFAYRYLLQTRIFNTLLENAKQIIIQISNDGGSSFITSGYQYAIQDGSTIGAFN